jgi:hypothetical protein
MSSLAEIESAAKQLPPAEQRKLVRSLTANLRTALPGKSHATGKRAGADYLLAAPAGAPGMTPELVKQLLEDFP